MRRQPWQLRGGQHVQANVRYGSGFREPDVLRLQGLFAEQIARPKEGERAVPHLPAMAAQDDLTLGDDVEPVAGLTLDGEPRTAGETLTRRQLAQRAVHCDRW